MKDVQNLFDVDRNTIQSWCKIFKDYLLAEKNRNKNQPGVFSLEDLSALSYINYHWEDEPDIKELLEKLENKEQLKAKGWIKNKLIELNSVDPESTKFRYDDAQIQQLNTELLCIESVI